MSSTETDSAARDPLTGLGDRFDIAAAAPMAHLRSPDTEAYRAVDRQHPGDKLYALILKPELIPRSSILDPLKSLATETVTRPIAWGAIEWPPAGRRAFTLIFEEPASRIAPSRDEPFPAFTEEEVISAVLPPVMLALKALFDLGIAHRAIRPDNLYRRGSDPRVLLGECVSAPPALFQPAAYEPIERAFAQPLGRGAGGPSDDLYALGVTLLALLIGKNPADGIDDETLLAARLRRGSFATLLENVRPPARMLEPIRGLLSDDPRERWNLADLDNWLQKRRVAPRQFAPAKRAARPLEVGDETFSTARTLAQAFVKDPAGAVKPIRAGTLDTWLQHSLGDPERIQAVASATIDLPEAEGTAREARLVARVAMALDPAAPVRYMGFAAMVDGFGPALAAAFRAGNAATAISDAIMARLPQFWFSAQGVLRGEHTMLQRSFDRMRQLLEDRRPGYGLARVLYELNPGLHCLSPTIEREHAIEAGDLLGALERAAAGGRLADAIVDRQVAAFIAARTRLFGPDLLDEVGSTNPVTRTLGTLKLLALLQGIRGPASAPALAQRLVGELPPLVERFHSTSRRARIQAQLGKVASRGKLKDLFSLVASPAELKRDDEEWRAARAAHAQIERALFRLRNGDDERAEQAAELGANLSVAAAGIIAVVVACASLAMAG